MANDAAIAEIRRWFDQRVSLERSALFLKALAILLFRLALVLGIALVLMALQTSRSWALLPLSFGLWSIIDVFFRSMAQWNKVRQFSWQAERLEQHVPALEGRARLIAERLNGPMVGESPQIMQWIASKVYHVVADVRVPPSVESARKLWYLASASWVFLVVFALVLPEGSTTRWFPEKTVVSKISALPRLRIGDVQIRLRYPDYTGLPEKEIQNSFGEIVGPPGTQIFFRAKSEVGLSQAVLEWENGEKLPVVVDEGRILRVETKISFEQQRFRFRTTHADGDRATDYFTIRAVPDEPPVVFLESPSSKIEVALDEQLPIQWVANDDYGISTVGFRSNGADLPRGRTSPSGIVAEFRSTEVPTPADLGLSAGRVIRLSVIAWDNDAVSGIKSGISKEIEVKILSAAGVYAKREERQNAWRERLIEQLAFQLETPWPLALDLQASWLEQMTARLKNLETVFQAEYRGATMEDKPAKVERDRIVEVVDSLKALFRFVIAIEKQEWSPAEVESAASLREKAIDRLEEAVLAFDFMIQQRLFRELLESVEQLSKSASSLEKGIDKPFSELERLRQVVAEDVARVRQVAERLEESSLQGRVLQHASEITTFSERSREAIAQADRNESEVRVRQTVAAVRELEQALKESMEQRSGEDALGQLSKELQELTKGQRARNQGSPKARSQAELMSQLEELQGSAKKALQKLTTGGREVMEELESAAKSMERAEKRKDAGAAEQAEQALRRAQERLEQAIEDQRAMMEPLNGEGQQGEEGQKRQSSRERGEEGQNNTEGESLPVEIPSEEWFKTPEEYRRELMEGMSGPIPEEYLQLQKRFYEELVGP